VASQPIIECRPCLVHDNLHGSDERCVFVFTIDTVLEDRGDQVENLSRAEGAVILQAGSGQTRGSGGSGRN